MKKAELRKLYLEKRASLSGQNVAEMSGLIAEQFFENVDVAAVKMLHSFIPIRKFNEVDTELIVRRIWLEFPDIVTAAPRTDLDTGTFESVTFGPTTELVENSWGIREPPGGEQITPVEIALVIVPLLCFDTNRHRVGYGKGMYDRFLATCRRDVLKVGVSLFQPVEPIEDRNLYDVPLDICITPLKTYFLNKKGCC
ncbi:MAG: 5-formyltetrahydrofolate cyclo-ligase [Pyrinomonadaceae bacterium]